MMSTRRLATYMGEYIPGNPNIMAQNMAGASSIIWASERHPRRRRAQIYFDPWTSMRAVSIVNHRYSILDLDFPAQPFP